MARPGLEPGTPRFSVGDDEDFDWDDCEGFRDDATSRLPTVSGGFLWFLAPADTSEPKPPATSMSRRPPPGPLRTRPLRRVARPASHARTARPRPPPPPAPPP